MQKYRLLAAAGEAAKPEVTTIAATVPMAVPKPIWYMAFAGGSRTPP